VSDLATRDDGLGVIERVVAHGDLSKLTPEQRASYYFEICSSLKLNPLTRPFEYLTINGKLLLYARKDATDQLRALHKVSLEITARETIGELYVVTAKARTPDGRTDEEIGAVTVKGLSGEAFANALMRASTKAKRRVTLSLCGLGFLDESELETIRDAAPVVFSDAPIPTTLEPDQMLPASTSGAAARLQAESGALPASMDPARHAQPALVEAPAAPDDPEYRRAVEATRAARALGVRVAEPPTTVRGREVWTQIADDVARMVRSKAPAR